MCNFYHGLLGLVLFFSTPICLIGEQGPGGEPAPYLPRPAGTLTFNKQIAPLVLDNCATCHRPGGAGPFDLLSYADVRRHGKTIVSVTQSRYMPPWQPEPGYGEFIGERRLSAEQIGMLEQWVDEGAVEGDPADFPGVPEWPAGWYLGEPDLVVTMPRTYTLAAEGPDVFRMFVIPVPLESKRYVRAVELRPGNPRVVHHAVGLVDPTSRSRHLDDEDPRPGFEGMRSTEFARPPDGHFLGWTPGKVPMETSEGTAWQLRKGTDLVWELHMLSSGKPERIQPSVGLYFTDEVPTKSPFILGLGSRTHDIPAGEEEYWIEDSYLLPVAVEVLGVYPHAHYLGKQMRAFARLPDGTRRWLIFIQDWDFNWQDQYLYTEPISLPRGTRLSMRYSYDNSADNIRNPHDPPRRVLFGPDSSDEMGDLWIQVLTETKEDRLTLQKDYEQKDIDRNIAGYQHLLRLNPDDATAHNDLGIFQAQQGDFTAALASFHRALQLEPRDPEVHNNLALALVQLGRLDDAIRYYRQALEIRPALLDAHYGLGSVLLAQGNTKEAIAVFQQALEIEPEFAKAHNNLGSAFAEQGDTARALAHFARAVAIEPDYAEAHHNLGNALLGAGKLNRAASEFERSLEIDPTYPNGHFFLGLAYYGLNQYPEAVELLKEAISRDPQNLNAHLYLGDCYLAVRRPNDAIAQLEKVLKLDDQISEAHALLGSAYVESGRLEEGVEAFQRAITLAPNNPGLHNQLAQVYQRLGMKEEAKKELEVFRKLDDRKN